MVLCTYKSFMWTVYYILPMIVSILFTPDVGNYCIHFKYFVQSKICKYSSTNNKVWIICNPAPNLTFFNFYGLFLQIWLKNSPYLHICNFAAISSIARIAALCLQYCIIQIHRANQSIKVGSHQSSRSLSQAYLILQSSINLFLTSLEDPVMPAGLYGQDPTYRWCILSCAGDFRYVGWVVLHFFVSPVLCRRTLLLTLL